MPIEKNGGKRAGIACFWLKRLRHRDIIRENQDIGRGREGWKMRLKDMAELVDARVLCGEELLDEEMGTAFASDLMSDVLAQVKGHPLLITGLCNPQVVRTAEMVDIGCILFVRGKRPDAQTVALAEDGMLCLLATDTTMFEVCGILYAHGCQGTGGECRE